MFPSRGREASEKLQIFEEKAQDIPLSLCIYVNVYIGMNLEISSAYKV